MCLRYGGRPRGGAPSIGRGEYMPLPTARRSCRRFLALKPRFKARQRTGIGGFVLATSAQCQWMTVRLNDGLMGIRGPLYTDEMKLPGRAKDEHGAAEYMIFYYDMEKKVNDERKKKQLLSAFNKNRNQKKCVALYLYSNHSLPSTQRSFVHFCII